MQHQCLPGFLVTSTQAAYPHIHRSDPDSSLSECIPIALPHALAAFRMRFKSQGYLGSLVGSLVSLRAPELMSVLCRSGAGDRFLPPSVLSVEQNVVTFTPWIPFLLYYKLQIHTLTVSIRDLTLRSGLHSFRSRMSLSVVVDLRGAC